MSTCVICGKEAKKTVCGPKCAGKLGGRTRRTEIMPKLARINAQGYRYYTVEMMTDQERALMPTANRIFLEHRLVMSQKLGRPLLSSELVRHMNGDKTDNRPENLDIGSAMDNKTDHMTDHMNAVRWRKLALSLFELLMHEHRSR